MVSHIPSTSIMDENSTITNDSNSLIQNENGFYSTLFGMDLAMPEWEALITIIALGLVIFTTIVGGFTKHYIIILSNW